MVGNLPPPRLDSVRRWCRFLNPHDTAATLALVLVISGGCRSHHRWVCRLELTSVAAGFLVYDFVFTRPYYTLSVWGAR